MPMPQYNGPMYSQGPTAVGPYNLQGYQPAFGYYGGQQNCYQSCGC